MLLVDYDKVYEINVNTAHVVAASTVNLADAFK